MHKGGLGPRRGGLWRVYGCIEGVLLAVSSLLWREGQRRGVDAWNEYMIILSLIYIPMHPSIRQRTEMYTHSSPKDIMSISNADWYHNFLDTDDSHDKYTRYQHTLVITPRSQDSPYFPSIQNNSRNNHHLVSF